MTTTAHKTSTVFYVVARDATTGAPIDGMATLIDCATGACVARVRVEDAPAFCRAVARYHVNAAMFARRLYSPAWWDAYTRGYRDCFEGRQADRATLRAPDGQERSGYRHGYDDGCSDLAGAKTQATKCSGCGKAITRRAPALPYSYCRTCRGR